MSSLQWDSRFETPLEFGSGLLHIVMKDGDKECILASIAPPSCRIYGFELVLWVDK